MIFKYNIRNDFDPSKAWSQTSFSIILLLTFNLKLRTSSEYSISSSVTFYSQQVDSREVGTYIEYSNVQTIALVTNVCY